MSVSEASPAARGSFAGLLRALRERAGLTQEELAERAGLTAHAVSALERGARTRPYPHTVRSLADALRLDDAERAALVAAVPRRRPAEPARLPGAGHPPVPASALPVPPTRLLGRERDIDAVAALVRDPAVRLVTLTGVGGVGKTRLGLAVAGAVAPAFPDGVGWVPLAALTDPGLVLPAIGRALGLAGTEPGGAADVVAHLRPLRLLLLLDNVEHLLDAAPDIGALLEACPGLTVLASSRAALRLRGEHEYGVPPLALASPAAGLAAVAAAPAAALFLDRARAVAPQFTLTTENAADVAQLCTRLAGIPLALELAAAKIRLLDPAALLARLDDAMASGGARDLPLRQRTMRATLDWSYDLLGEPEQRLFRRLSVFVGGFTLDAAEAVAEPGDPVLGLLEALVEQSLVLADGGAVRTRYRMLEPVAQYARLRLGDGDEARAARLAHAAHFLGVAERAVPGYRSADAVAALSLTEREEGNMVAALESTLEHGEAEVTGRLGWALWLYWWLRGHLLLGRRFMEAAVRHELSPPVRVRALLTIGAMSFAQGDLAASGPRWAEALEVARAGDDVEGMAHGHAGTGLVALATGDLDRAQDCFTRAIPLAEAADADDEWLWTLAHVWLGTIRVLRGQPREGLSLVDTALAAARRRGDRLAIYIGLFTAAQAAIALGDHDRARRQLEEGIVLSQETGDLANLAYFLEALAVVEASAGRARRVAVLTGAAQELRETVGANVYGYYRPDEQLQQRAVEQARARLGTDAFDDAVDEGRGLDLDEVVRVAVTGDSRLRLVT